LETDYFFLFFLKNKDLYFLNFKNKNLLIIGFNYAFFVFTPPNIRAFIVDKDKKYPV